MGSQRDGQDWAALQTPPPKKVTIKYFKGKYRTDHLKGKET